MMGDGPDSWPRCSSPGCIYPQQCVANYRTAQPPYLGVCCSEKTCCEEGEGQCDTDDGYFWCPIYEWGTCYQFNMIFSVDANSNLPVPRTKTCNLDSSPSMGTFWAENTCAQEVMQQFTFNSSHMCFYNPEMKKVQWFSDTVAVWPSYIGFGFAGLSAMISLFGLYLWIDAEIQMRNENQENRPLIGLGQGIPHYELV